MAAAIRNGDDCVGLQVAEGADGSTVLTVQCYPAAEIGALGGSDGAAPPTPAVLEQDADGCAACGRKVDRHNDGWECVCGASG